MAKWLQKFLQRCVSKIKNPYPQIDSTTSSRNWILSGCKQSRTPSFAIARRKNDAATLSDIDRFLSENFTTLFNEDNEDTPSSSNNNNIHNNNNNNNHNNAFTRVFGQENLKDSRSRSNSPDSTRFPELASPDLGGSSDSLESIVVLRQSASPQEDFGRSMMEMVETRLENCEKVDWGFLQELLFCYLNLNEKKSHGFILSAFVDLVNTLCGRFPARAPATAKPRSVRTVRVGRKKKTEVRLAFEEKEIASNANKGRFERSIGFEV